MNNTESQAMYKPTGFVCGNQYQEDISKEALRQLDKLEYRKNALLRNQNDLRIRLTHCENEIAEVEYEMRLINLEIMGKMKINRNMTILSKKN